MSTREAAIKLTLKDGAFRSGLRSVLTEVRAVGQQAGRALAGPMKAGVENAKASIKEMASSVTSTMKTAATLGGAVGFGALVKSAVNAEARATRLAAQLTTYTQKLHSAADAQAVLDRTVDKTKISYEEAGEAMNHLGSLATVGGVKMVEDALIRSQLQARRLGVTGEVTARTYNRLLAKGIAKSAEEAERLTEQMSQFGRVTMGLDPDEAIDPMDVAEFASFAKQAGIEIDVALALLKKTGGESVKDFGQASEFVEEFGNQFRDVGALGDLRKELGISPAHLNTSKNGLENFLTVLDQAGPKGVKSIMKSFGNERTKASLRKLIGEDLIVDIEKGKKGSKERLKLRAEEIRKELKEAAKGISEANSGINDTNDALTSTSSAKFQDALNKMEKAFQKPEMISAIDSLASNLPELAKVVSQIVDFAVKNPKTAVAGILGAKVGISFASGALADAGSRIGGKIVGALTDGTAVSAAKNIGSHIAQSATAAGPWKSAGAVLGVAAAGAIGFEIGKRLSKETIEKSLNEAAETKTSLVGKTSSAFAAEKTGSVESKQRALAALEAEIAAAKKKHARGAEMDAGDWTAFGALGPLGFFLKRAGEYQSAMGSGTMKDAEGQAERLREQLAKAGDGGDKAGKSLERAATAVEKFTESLDKASASGSGGSPRGPKPLGTVNPGSNPRSG